jgi:predicted AAA+ superfamily ATPase
LSKYKPRLINSPNFKYQLAAPQITIGAAPELTIPQVADSLAGRIEITDLLPLSQSELRKQPCDILERVFNGKPLSIGRYCVLNVLTALETRSLAPVAPADSTL